MKTSASATFIHGAPFIDINIANRVYGSEDWNKKTRTAKRLSLDQWDAVQHPRRQDLRGCLPPTRAYCRGQHSFDRTSLKIWWLRDRIFFLNSSNMSVSSLCLDSGRSGVSRLSVSQPTDPRSTVHGHIIHIKFQGLQYLALIPLRSLATAPPPSPLPNPPKKRKEKKNREKKKNFSQRRYRQISQFFPWILLIWTQAWLLDGWMLEYRGSSPTEKPLVSIWISRSAEQGQGGGCVLMTDGVE